MKAFEVTTFCTLYVCTAVLYCSTTLILFMNLIHSLNDKLFFGQNGIDINIEDDPNTLEVIQDQKIDRHTLAITWRTTKIIKGSHLEMIIKINTGHYYSCCLLA